MSASRVYLVFLLVVVSSVPWRKGMLFTGGLDSVVIAKAGLTLLALSLALLGPRVPQACARLPGAPVLLLAAYLTTTVVGALLNGSGFTSFVLAVRIGLVAVTVLAVMASCPWPHALAGLAAATLTLAVVGAATGLDSIAATGRLYGGVPPLNANEICLLLSLPVLHVFSRCMAGKARMIECLALPPMLCVIWLTGARTGLAALVVGLLLVLALTPRAPALMVALCGLAVPGLVYVTFFTTLLGDYARRGDAQSLTALNSRTVAWAAAVEHPDTTTELLLGFGVGLRKVPVSAADRTEQLFDSTWISALVQSGYLGASVLLLLCLTTLRETLRRSSPFRAVRVGLVSMLLVRSLLESGLFDATPSCVIFLTVALGTSQVSDRTCLPAAPDDRGAADGDRPPHAVPRPSNATCRMRRPDTALFTNSPRARRWHRLS